MERDHTQLFVTPEAADLYQRAIRKTMGQSYTDQGQVITGHQYAGEVKPPESDISLFEALEAGFKTMNPFSSATYRPPELGGGTVDELLAQEGIAHMSSLTFEPEETFEPVEGYNALEDKTLGLEPHMRPFVANAQSPQEAMAIKKKVEEENDLMAQLEAAGVMGFTAGMAASITPLDFLAVPLVAGGRIKSMRSAFLLTTALYAPQELALMHARETQSSGETFLTLATIGAMGSALAAVAGPAGRRRESVSENIISMRRSSAAQGSREAKAAFERGEEFAENAEAFENPPSIDAPASKIDVEVPDAEFDPTNYNPQNDYLDVDDDVVAPPGLEWRVNMDESGGKQARLPEMPKTPVRSDFESEEAFTKALSVYSDTMKQRLIARDWLNEQAGKRYGPEIEKGKAERKQKLRAAMEQERANLAEQIAKSRSAKISAGDAEADLPKGVVAGKADTATQEQVDAVYESVRETLNEMGLSDVKLSVVGHEIQIPVVMGDNIRMMGAQEFTEKVIYLSVSPDVRALMPGAIKKDIVENAILTGRHEALHAMRSVGVITDAEWEVLLRNAKYWRRRFLIDHGYQRAPQWMREEEAIAHGYEMFKRQELSDSAVVRIFQKLKEFMERIRNKLIHKDPTTAADIFRRFDDAEEMMARNREGSIEPNRATEGFMGAQRLIRNDASRMREQELKDEQLVGTGIGLENVPLNPMLRMLKSPFAAGREAVSRIVPLGGMVQEKNTRGVATAPSAETMYKQNVEPRIVGVIKTIEDGYLDYLEIPIPKNDTERVFSAGRRAAQDGLDKLRGESSGRPSYGQFRQDIGAAMQTSDVASHLPEGAYRTAVEQAARKLRNELNSMGEEANTLGLFDRPLEADIKRLEKEIRDIKQKVRTEGNRLSPEDKEALASRETRIQVLEGQLEQLRRHGPVANTGDSFFPRVWRKDVVEKKFNELVDVFANEWKKRGDERSMDELRQEARELIESTILRNEPYVKLRGDDEFDNIAEFASLRARSLDIDDVLVRDFLNLDAEEVIRFYMGNVGKDIELARVLGGDITGRKIIDTIREEAEALRKAAPSHSQRAKISKEEEIAIRDFRVLRDRFRGTYGLPDDPYRPISRFMRAMKQINVLLYGGQFAIAAIPDLARTVMTEGLRETYQHGLKHYFSESRKIIRQMNRAELQAAGTALDMILGTRALQFADLADMFGHRFPAERALTRGTGAYFVVNGLHMWNTAMKEFAGMVIAARINRDVLSWADGTISQADMAKLARHGIDENMANRIAAQLRAHAVNQFGEPVLDYAGKARLKNGISVEEFQIIHDIGSGKTRPEDYTGNQWSRLDLSVEDAREIVRSIDDRNREWWNRVLEGPADIKHSTQPNGQHIADNRKFVSPVQGQGITDDTVVMPNTDDWTDVEARRRYRAALNQDVDRTIITPDSGDRANWTSTEFGSVIAQFKSFGQAAMPKMMVSGLQERDAAFWSGAMMMVGFGFMVSEIKGMLYGNDRERSFSEQLVEAVDRSGIMGWVMDVNNGIERMTDYNIGINAALGNKPPWNASRESQLGTMFGPTGSTLGNTEKVLRDFVTGDVDHWTYERGKRLIPGNNLPVVSPLL